MRILITSGGTAVKIDSVRNLTNFSNGGFMSRLATSFLEQGHQIYYLTQKYAKTPLQFNVNLKDCHSTEDQLNARKELERKLLLVSKLNSNMYYETSYFFFEEYREKLFRALRSNSFDMILLGAAVSDFVLADPMVGKIESGNGKDLTIKLSRAEKLISRVKEISPSSKLIGFKLLVNCSEEELGNACRKSIENNGCDAVIGNDLMDINEGHPIFIYNKKVMDEPLRGLSAKYNCNSIAKVLCQI